MTYFTIAEARAAGRFRTQREFSTAETLLRKSATVGQFDIFLSHSFQDAEVILGVKAILEQSGKRVYVDWINDPQLDRSRVSATTAHHLRERMNQCRSFVYAATKAATTSTWMPWELGYFDGRNPEAVAILPLVEYQGQDVGQEYLDLYPKIEQLGGAMSRPVVTRRRASLLESKSIDDLVRGRGGSAWS